MFNGSIESVFRCAGTLGDRQLHHLAGNSNGGRPFTATEETTEEVAGAILDGLEYLVREAHAAGLRDLAKALTGVMLSPGHWPQPGRG